MRPGGGRKPNLHFILEKTPAACARVIYSVLVSGLLLLSVFIPRGNNVATGFVLGRRFRTRIGMGCRKSRNNSALFVPVIKRCCACAKVGEAMPKAILMLIGNFPLFAILSKLAALLCWSVHPSVRPAVRPLHLKLSHESVLSLSPPSFTVRVERGGRDHLH